jgi:hypothetical protein
MSTCHILKSVCLACGKPFSTKLKLCKEGASGHVCLRTDLNAQVNVWTDVGGNGRACLDLTEIMEVVVVRNRNPLCSCGESMDAPNTKELERSEDAFVSGDGDEFMTGRGYVKTQA